MYQSMVGGVVKYDKIIGGSEAETVKKGLIVSYSDLICSMYTLLGGTW